MTKYETLKGKLDDIIMYIDHMLDTMDFKYEASREYLFVYKKFVESIIRMINSRTIPNSDGKRSIGLIRGLSEHDELCNDDKLWKMVGDADIYYKNKCKKF